MRFEINVASKRAAGRRLSVLALPVLGLLALGVPAQPAQAGLFDWAGPQRYQEIAPPPALDSRAQHYGRRYGKPKRKHNESVASKEAVEPGPLHIIVSIARQRVTLFSNGKPVAEAPVSTGVAGHPTPMGIFAVISKARHHASNIYSGAPMPFMHRITWSGIALHEGPLPGYAASHGCIRLPGAFASKLFGITKVGARVIITREPTAPFEIASAKLFVPRTPAEQPDAIPLAGNVPDVQRQVEIAAAAIGLTPASEPKTPDIEVKVAEAKRTDVTGTVVEPAAPADILKMPDAKPAASSPAIAQPVGAPKRKGPVQVFVSRKEGKLYVRQGFAPLFDAPVAIPDPTKPWGTHVFTAMQIADGKVRWTAVTIPSGYTSAADNDKRGRKISQKEAERRAKRAYDLANAPKAADALDLFEMPKDAVERISELLAQGSALIVSDNALSDETGLETDFIVATQ